MSNETIVGWKFVLFNHDIVFLNEWMARYENAIATVVVVAMRNVVRISVSAFLRDGLT